MTSTVIFCKLKRTYGLVVKASCWVGFQQYAETLGFPSAILGGTRVSVLTRVLYIAVLSIFFSLLDFVSGDLALTGF